LTWPYHLSCCSCISWTMFSFIPIFVLIASFLILSIRDILAERLKCYQNYVVVFVVSKLDICGDPYLILCDFTWDSLSTKWQLSRFLSHFFSFPPLIIIPPSYHRPTRCAIALTKQHIIIPSVLS
jgi:hypothetical protein